MTDYSFDMVLKAWYEKRREIVVGADGAARNNPESTNMDVVLAYSRTCELFATKNQLEHFGAYWPYCRLYFESKITERKLCHPMLSDNPEDEQGKRVNEARIRELETEWREIRTLHDEWSDEMKEFKAGKLTKENLEYFFNNRIRSVL